MVKGLITASVGGLYSVKLGNGETITCKARGLFRLNKIKPCVGDLALIQEENGDNREPVIAQIEERRNFLIRPPLANIDRAIIVVSSREPKPNALIIDKLTVVLESKNIEPVFVFTKIDKMKAALFQIYKSAGFVCFSDCFNNAEELSRLSEELKVGTSALIGNTGVGKTTLLNLLNPALNLPTAEISKKLGRGKHTTRTVELLELPSGGYIADTPGFSALENKLYGDIRSFEVARYFREFAPFIDKCRFKGCAHVGEDFCAIKDNVGGLISQSRLDSYIEIYKSAKENENSW